ncbi:MAG: hypothetical protein Q7W38_13265 [Deltaproteobacteria bacterium]|nr:hypothetical protein [Deltaproteobacteria bacterium]
MAILYNFLVISQFVGGKSLIIFVIFCNSEVFSQARAKGHPAGQNKAAVSSLPKRGLLPIGERGVLLSPRFLIAETRPVVMGNTDSRRFWRRRLSFRPGHETPGGNP